ncbi:MAG: CRISPR-associated protein Csx3 [Thaumarchaeota archaeon]|nr:CRISPR-associated protein Csx3 [Nitrososphaerota archaeon]
MDKSEETVVIDLNKIFTTVTGAEAKLSDLERYVEQAKGIAGDGNIVVLTGAAPVWLYLKIAHALHGKARRLVYDSPVTGRIIIFDHDPW